MSWLVVVAILGLVGFLLDREIYFYEGAHLGPRLQAWLYDRWSKKYDEGKRASQLHDDKMLAQPLLDALHAVPEPFVLDFATGTGRLSYVLLNQSDFRGNIVALDLSQGMLEQAAAKLHGLGTSEKKAGSTRLAGIAFLRHVSLPLPFPDAAFDAVCALEVLELFPSMDEPLRELTRVLRPGGVLLTSRGTEESGRKAKVKSARDFTSSLEQHGMGQIRITKWWKLFDRVLAVKHGSSTPMVKRGLSQVLRCASCGQTHWAQTSRAWHCKNCGQELLLTEQKIVLN
jgi:ubiquinone/menaquinone biosynthesis C-methylase UbiE